MGVAVGGRHYRKKTLREQLSFYNWGAGMLEYLIYQISALAFCAGLLVGTVLMVAIDRWII
ncbi:hypothetical protein ABQE69_12095 [Mycolicibacillus trivialis]|uniref:hypothetical protein n=1 Tax=Mycolicibacillus trivialis TaxID=1798 RepID=UPI001054667F|nr:hypothetical protein [Mycolicibacillus trivialis]